MINWGIIGIGYIAGRFAASVQHEPNSKLKAVSSRSQQKADDFAAKFSAEKVYTGHELLLADDDIQAVYIALPHGMHHEWAIRALKAGKAVLCEKPATLNVEEMKDIINTARSENVLFMEAMKPRFVPLYNELKSLLNDGVIGQIVSVETSLCNLMHLTGKTYHTQPKQGGVLLDVGIYCASWLEDFLGTPNNLKTINYDLRDGIDYYVGAELEFNGKIGRLECAFDRTKPRQAIIRGEKGYIIIDELHRPQNMTIFKSGENPNIIKRAYEVDDFYGEIHHFVKCLEDKKIESDIMTLNTSLNCANILKIMRNKLI